jgi:hypothetical protein
VELAGTALALPTQASIPYSPSLAPRPGEALLEPIHAGQA